MHEGCVTAGSRARHSAWVAVLGLASVTLTSAATCRSGDDSSPGSSAIGGASDAGESTSDAGASPPEQPAAELVAGTTNGSTPLALPDTEVGRQLAWLLEALNQRGGNVPEPELREHFSEAFLASVPPLQLTAVLASVASSSAPLLLVALSERAAGSALEALVNSRGGQGIIDIQVEPSSGLITGLLFRPTADLQSGRPTSWEAVDSSVSSLAPRTNYLVAKVDGDTCAPLHGSRSEDRLALGSAFKLYVLAELARQIDAGLLGWESPLVIHDALKSLPSGQLQDVPDGTVRSVLDVATNMISISDNTAADHLIDRLGRENVEAEQSRVGHGAPELNIPFLSTREFFLFKLNASESDVSSYLAADLPARRAVLASLAGQTPALQAAASWTLPRYVEEIEWFASASDLCRLMASLDAAAERAGLAPLHDVLSKNPGLRLDPAAFPYIAFKGGSEPGVLQLTWLVHHRDGTRYFVSLSANDTQAPVDETPALRAALGIFDLLASDE
jgi:beta-lactamase class A